MKIGVFDSGVGGLTVLKSIYDKYPNNEYIYIGDNKNSPYGDKTKEELFGYASRIVDYFIKRDAKLIVVACNTICSNALDLLKEKYKDITFVGVIDSTINLFMKKDKRKVLVIGTTKTIMSNIYEEKIKLLNNNIEVFSLPTPQLVPLIEKGKCVKEVLDNYLKPFNNIDSIILGCTHYKIIENDINKNITIVNSSDGVVDELNDLLLNKDNSKLEIYTTGNVDEFNKLCLKIMKKRGEYIRL